MSNRLHRKLTKTTLQPKEPLKTTDDFHYERKPSHITAKLILFAVSKNDWGTKENTGESIKNACNMPKRYILTFNSEKSSP